MTKIAVHMTGGIAVYKAVEVVRGLQKQGHEVRVAMTQNAARFVGPATLAALTSIPFNRSVGGDFKRSGAAY